MSEALLKNVQEMLNEEKWTRATLSNYSTNQFKELDVLLQEARDARAYDELKKLCDEHLVHTKNSIIALYLSGMIALSRQLIDDSALINLVTIFVDNHKWNIVKYLCERILDHGESKFALRTLSECYKNDNEEEAIYGIWERLVKVDYEEADLAKSLAEYYEKQARLEEAVDFYKKALHRYINKGLFTNVREIWTKLIEYCKDDIDFFLHVQKKIAKNISKEKAVLLLNDVYVFCKAKDDIDTAISICKIILEYDERDEPARKEITECFRKKYADHSQLEEYIRISNLATKYRNVHEAITDFEKHIAFDKGNYVFHRTWGIGRIAKVQGDEIVIDFAKKREHSMGLKMAVNALQTISKNHIWVLKATKKKDELHDKVKDDPEWALKTVIKSFNNTCDIKRIKAEFVPAILSAGEWTTWSSKARDILKANTSFGVSPDNIDTFTVRDRPISIEEKLYNEFKAERNFFDRVATIRSYVAQKDVELDSEYFTEMFAYFTGYLRSKNQLTEQVASYILVKDLIGRYPHLGTGLSLNFPEVFEEIDDVPSLFLNLKDAKLKEEFLHHIQLFVPSWPEIYIKLFPFALSASIINSLKKEGYEDQLVAMTQYCFESYRDHREARDAAVWILKNLKSEPWFERTGLTEERQLIVLIHILNVSYREIENHRETTENRKTNKQVYTILFKDEVLINFIEQGDPDTITRIYTLIDDVKDLDPADKLNLKNRIIQKYPQFKFLGDTEKTVTSRGLLVTMGMYEEKQRQLVHIMDVEVPANSKEIAFALSLGDLRENAEYKAAKEKQDILNSTVAKLKDEIERAQLFDPQTINANRVSFGTKVTLDNESNGAKEEYTILGPWESDPENKIISYLSPFGNAILNKKVGEKFNFAINDEKIAYTVKEISAVSF
ncbi:transcription elongation factor [Treponema primitia ZAS-2]|uniref:Transcription elongation factor GreA n=1 Tax=Treponema primitia (strain ATCC BAA-887 / DSM 12427 / ZAS-2) TaxID=545694 RepID=F5YMV1_TREPZ|nr:transcription elongation factor GreA [Treponema primitia]AEF85085.1 transcription elongation factor [Treponema primitia ZAS-2]